MSQVTHVIPQLPALGALSPSFWRNLPEAFLQRHKEAPLESHNVFQISNQLIKLRWFKSAEKKNNQMLWLPESTFHNNPHKGGTNYII